MSCTHYRIAQAATALASGEVIAYPTEAVWGLGCDPYNQRAVQDLLALKRRPQEKGLILIAGRIEQFAPLLSPLTAAQRAQLEETWPGPTTWLVPHHQQIPHWVSGKHDTIALRVSDHPIVRELCRAFGGPIISTSANPQGLAPARDGFRVRQYFGKRVRIVPGPLGKQQNPSEIRDLVSGKVIRPG